MAQSSYPFDGQTTTETQFSQFFRELQDTGVAASADSLGLKVTADSGGMRVFLGIGSAMVRGFFYINDASLQLTIAAADTSARIDRVVLRLDPAANSIVAAVIKGTPGAGVPALTQTDTAIYELPLAQVAVGASVSTIAAGNVTDERRFTPNGTGTWTTATRPTSPRKGVIGLNTTTGAFEFWDGAAWAPLLNFTALSGTPSTFTPGPHTHPWADVTGKPSTYPPSGHTHSADKYLGSSGSSFIVSNANTHTIDQSWADQGSGTLPAIVACMNNTTAWTVSVTNVTATGCRLNFRKLDGVNYTGTLTYNWIAMFRQAPGAAG